MAVDPRTPIPLPGGMQPAQLPLSTTTPSLCAAYATSELTPPLQNRLLRVSNSLPHPRNHYLVPTIQPTRTSSCRGKARTGATGARKASSAKRLSYRTTRPRTIRARVLGGATGDGRACVL
ncbi:hypothetical protein K466DRAFT_589226 [Polyporus arcularius HHB13444]|uniref:Uncharacterized protein n=1 Tax=Polyporus arcularius HHB13444 TaxID=1314778 RepID=A0A5C3P4C7_9APHY|nr:hypothetical protein K466DRAFT_589226 [Polyporus arcularius HHB13444]